MFTKDSVEKVAHLAKIELNEQEISDFQLQLVKVFKYFQKMTEANTEGIDPLVTPVPMELVLRADTVDQEQSVEELLSLAPETQGHLYRVPPVV